MLKHKNKIIIAVIVLAALAGAWFFGGGYGGRDGDAPQVLSQNTGTPAVTNAVDTSAPYVPESAPPAASPPTAAPSASGTPVSAPPETPPNAPVSTQPAPPESSPDTPVSTPSAPPSEAPPDETEKMTDPGTGGDEQLTDPVPGGNPLPVEPEDMTVGDGSFTVTLSVRCDTILSSMDLLNAEKHELVPGDGVIFPAAAVTVYEGESVFNVLQREMKRAGIHMEFMNTPIYSSAYIEGIGNLYEFDVGELSGWMYKVNGWCPNYGCSRYQLQPGDVVEWQYTCDLGADLGVEWLEGAQKDA